jgi:hypothetical protein
MSPRWKRGLQGDYKGFKSTVLSFTSSALHILYTMLSVGFYSFLMLLDIGLPSQFQVVSL